MGKREKRGVVPGGAPPGKPSPETSDRDEIDFPTVVWSLAILAVLVILHRLIWGG